MSVAPLLLSGVSKSFGDTKVLEDIDFALKDNTICGVIGPNGAGKTTLINIVTGQLQPSSGRVELLGSDVTGLGVHERARLWLGRSFQITSIFANLSVRDNIRCALLWSGRHGQNLLHNVSKNRSLDKRVDEALELVGLSQDRDKTAGLLTYGQQRALELAMTIAPGSHVLLLDEPTAGMTRVETEHAIGVIRRVAKGRSVLIVEHDMSVVFGLCDRVAVLSQGRMIADGPPDTVRQDPDVQRAYFGDSQ